MYEAYNPVEDRMGFSTRGTFRCSRATEQISVILAFIITLMIFAAFYFMWKEQFMYIYSMNERTDHSLFFALGFSGITAVIIIVFIVAVSFLLGGVEYSYTANENMFSFVSKKDGVRKTDIHYNDVIAVSYKQRRLFGIFDRGFTVTIITHTLGNVTLLYKHNRSIKVHSPENTPFHIIEERMDIQNEKQKYGRL